MNSRIVLLTSLLLALLMSASCKRRQLYEEITGNVRIESQVKWEKSRWQEFDIEDGSPAPTGMSVYAYDVSGEYEKPVVVATNDTGKAVVNLPEGEWNIFIFNQTVAEYSSFGFREMDSYYDAYVETISKPTRWFGTTRAEWLTRSNSPYAVQTRTRSRSRSATRAEADETTTNQPVWFAADRSEGLVIDADEVVRGYRPHSKTRFTASPDSIYYPLCAIVRMGVKIHIRGFDNLLQTRAVVSGVSKAWNISRGEPMDELTAHEITNLQMVKDTETPGADTITDGYGYVMGTFQTFGLSPDFRGNKNELWVHIDLHLTGNVKYKDEKGAEHEISYVSYDIPVGDKVKREDIESGVYGKPGQTIDVDLEIDTDRDAKDNFISLPHVEADGNGSGFNITVSDWEDEIVIPIEL